jgi:hypothetical protein
MKLIFSKSFKYSDNGLDIITVEAGGFDIPERFVAGCLASGVAHKANAAPLNKAKPKPKNKAK